ncbi:RNA methyltransferase [Jatrophihabitans sp.]|uniref:TrmH family RNA methyltransferase n=1 Tax=Jatrophihabitans sp. TaxID=1932789 RepID=UPI0030C67270|nr:tRNA (Ribose-2-O)-methylase SpoU [Jatrophihabitans sp.]
MQLIEVSDAADDRLADFRDLMDSDVRPDRRGVVIAEGVNVVERLLSSPYPVRAVFGVPARIEALRPFLEPLDVPVFVADKWLLSDVVGFRVTRGVLAAAERATPPDLDALLGGARHVAVLEALNDFENLGALFRNAAAFGVDAVLLDPRCADPLYRRSVRVSMGHVLRIPFVTLPGPWPASLSVLATHGFQTLALTPAAETDLRRIVPPERWAVLLGAEGPGLTLETLAMADHRVAIPMAPGVDSLNVATAAAVAFAHLS